MTSGRRSSVLVGFLPVLQGLLAMTPRIASGGEAPAAFASIRVVRQTAGEPGKPEIALPEGYALLTNKNYEVASRGEYYVFLTGPKGVARGIRIHWPGQQVRAVIHNNTHLELREAAPDAWTCDVPVQAPSAREAWPSLEVHSYYNESDLSIRIEHNDPDRAAGYFADHPWVAGQAKAAVNFIFAARRILRDWGLHHEIAREKVGHLALMGFESNNPLHLDSPPHWHLIYYWPGPGSPGSRVPHFYLDERGRITSDRMDVLGKGTEGVLKAGQPMACADPQGKMRLAMQIRPDGGLDLGPAPGDWTYSIVPGDAEGGFTDSVRVLRRGQPWIRVAAKDDVKEGRLRVRVEPIGPGSEPSLDEYHYDPLTGAPRIPKP